MTAVAGILNKRGIAIAADSAVTVSGGRNRKVYNSANKIFTLSKYHPVGIAIYNDSQFMGVPWGVIIKEYRKYLGDRSFPFLSDYKEDFFRWLEENNFFAQDDMGDHLIRDFNLFLESYIEGFQFNGTPSLQEFLTYSQPLLRRFIEKIKASRQLLDSFKDLQISDFHDNLSESIHQFVSFFAGDINDKAIYEQIKALMLEAYEIYLKHDYFINYTGLIFTGFGDREVFPRLLPVNASIVIENKLRYADNLKDEAVISNANSACIRPFAQTDVIDTILQGVSPELSNLSSKIFSDTFNQFLSEIKGIPELPQNFKERLNKIKTADYVDYYNKSVDRVIRANFVTPLMDAVSHLSKEDLAEMAESLVYLTYLKRRFTMAEESVGGPVDIAVITKGDGFIWIKRKHYFDPELNPIYFQKYLKT